MASIEVWDRQPNETSRSYAMFANYRDAGPYERSIARVAREFNRPVTAVQQIATKYGWIPRAMAWDEDNERIKRATQIKEIEGMARRQILAGQLFMSKGLKRIQGMSDDEVKLMSIWEATRLTEVGTKLELLGRGAPPDLDQRAFVQQNVILGGSAETSLIDLMRRNPTRVGPVVELLGQLREMLPELTAGPRVSDTIIDGDSDLDDEFPIDDPSKDGGEPDAE